MARRLTYAQQTHDSPNPIARFAHRTRYKVSLELTDRLLPEGGTLVDFGAGEGTFLDKVGHRRPDARLLAIEPYQTIAFPNIARVSAMRDIPDQTVDVVGAFEVLEHVTDEQLREFLAGARAILKPGGKLLVTVPVMYGLALPVKEASRAILHRRRSDTGIVDTLKAAAGIRIERAANRLSSHKGFDFRWLRDELAAGFRITEQQYSPFPGAQWWVNSQAIFVAE
jgi:cyclopropane fatty-acyl-phospholipid synthase-like methyltransferase